MGALNGGVQARGVLAGVPRTARLGTARSRTNHFRAARRRGDEAVLALRHARPVAPEHPPEHELLRHHAVVVAVTPGPGVVGEHPPARAPALRHPLDDEQVLLERVPQHHDVTRSDPCPVPDEQAVPVTQRGQHRGPPHLGDAERNPRFPYAHAPFRLRHRPTSHSRARPAPSSGPAGSQSHPGLLA
ncbi:putative signal peptidase protein [Streptomyces sp. Tu6071]|nr:putative signal peptidase protein [Streptomyces sp. Tu6071]